MQKNMKTARLFTALRVDKRIQGLCRDVGFRVQEWTYMIWFEVPS